MRLTRGCSPPLLPSATPLSKLSTEFQRCLTRLAHSFHLHSIRLAARIWGIVDRHHTGSVERGDLGYGVLCNSPPADLVAPARVASISGGTGKRALMSLSSWWEMRNACSSAKASACMRDYEGCHTLQACHLNEFLGTGQECVACARSWQRGLD